MSYQTATTILDSLRIPSVQVNDPHIYTLASGLAEIAQTLGEESQACKQQLSRIETLLIEIRENVRPSLIDDQNQRKF